MADSGSFEATLEAIQQLRREKKVVEARAQIEAFCHEMPADTQAPARAKVLLIRADMRSMADEHDAAIEAYLDLIPSLDDVGESTQAAISVNNLSYHYAMKNQREEALQALRDSVERRRVLAKQPFLMRAYFNLGYWYLEWNRLAEAESALRVAIQMGRVWPDPKELGTSLLYLGRTVARNGRGDRALLAYTEAIPLLRAAELDSLVTEASREMAAITSVTGRSR